MSETTETQTIQTAETTRAFYRSDYAKAARLVRNMRHVKCQPGTAKDEASQGKANHLAIVIAEVFAEDAPEGKFSAEKFLAGTQLPAGNVLMDSPPADEGTEDDDTDDE